MRRYLIVDDNLDFAENVAEILRDRGDVVGIATGGEEAIALARGTRFDALLTDMRMPSMGGAEVVHEIRRFDPGLAALVITGFARDDQLEAARREGLLAVLPKPVQVDHLLALLDGARRDGLVAVVEDDADFADNVCELLRGRGFAACTAASVLETERLGPVAPFCALVDLRVPGGPDGEAMRRLAVRYPGLPMIVVTGLEAEAPLPHQGRFSKPFDSTTLLATLERLHAARRPGPVPA